MRDNKKSHIFNIDNLLINIPQRVWIIERDKPNKCLLRIPKEDYDLIKTGVFKDDNLSMMFNGKKYWLSRYIFNKLKKRVRKAGTSENLSFSFREYTDPDTIQNMKIEYDLTPIEHLKNSIDDIYFISTKGTERRYGRYYTKLIDDLREDGIIVKQVYYLNQSYFAQSSDMNVKKVCYVILSNILGREIRDNELGKNLNREYSEVHYYDTNHTIIHKIRLQINSFLKRLNGDNFNKTKLFLNSVGSNRLNPFTSIEVDLNKFIRTFEQFTHTPINEDVVTGEYVSNHVIDITPYESDIPNYFIERYIKPNNFKLTQVSIDELIENDPDLKEYVDSNYFRYKDNTNYYEPTDNELYHPIVVVNNEVLDGYSRITTLKSLGDKYIDAYVSI